MARGVKHVARATSAALAIAAAAGCSSGSSPKATTSTAPQTTLPPATTTTLPLAQQQALVQAYFRGNGKGKPLLVFLRGVQPLLNGSTLDRAQCLSELQRLQPLVGSGKVLNQLISDIPARPLYDTFIDVFSYESTVFGFCGNDKAIPDGALRLAHEWSARVKPSLAYYGVQY